jgi:hypothetical protein
MVLAYVSVIKNLSLIMLPAVLKIDVKFVQLDQAEHSLAHVPRPETDNRVS